MSETPPVYSEHPAKGLSSLVSEETATQLSKTTIRLFTELPTYHDTLKALRNHEKFSYVVQWLYSMRGLIKLSNDTFDIDAFEEELLGISGPKFVNKFRLGLVQLLNVNKSSETTLSGEQFSEQVQLLLPEEFSSHSQEELEKFDFDALSLPQQCDIYHQLVMLCTSHNVGNLRRLVDKYERPVDDCRPMIVFTQDDLKGKTRGEYLFLLDHRLYYRKWQYDYWDMPKNRQDVHWNVKDSICRT